MRRFARPPAPGVRGLSTAAAAIPRAPRLRPLSPSTSPAGRRTTPGDRSAAGPWPGPRSRRTPAHPASSGCARLRWRRPRTARNNTSPKTTARQRTSQPAPAKASMTPPRITAGMAMNASQPSRTAHRRRSPCGSQSGNQQHQRDQPGAHQAPADQIISGGFHAVCQVDDSSRVRGRSGRFPWHRARQQAVTTSSSVAEQPAHNRS